MRSSAGILALGLIALACAGAALTESAVTRSPLVIAHRGAAASAPEHTIAAYDRAVELRADYIELDVHRTRDGALVVIHDATLDRTVRGAAGDCTGRVVDRTLAQIESCDAGSWFNTAYPTLARSEFAGLRVPRLASVLNRYHALTGLYMETKDPDSYPGIEGELVALLKAYGVKAGPQGSPGVFIQSFSKTSLLRVRQLDPDLQLIQLFGAMDPSAITAQLSDIRTYASGIGVRKEDVTAALVESAHASCLLLHAYTSDDPAEMQSLLAMGVDGIFSGRPGELRGAVDRAADGNPGETGCIAAAR